MQSNPAAEFFEPYARRYVRTKKNKLRNATGLNRKHDQDDERDEYRPIPKGQAVGAWHRYKICERMRDEVVPYSYPVEKWARHYTTFKKYRNDDSLKFVRLISHRRLRSWYYNIAMKPQKMSDLYDALMELPRNIRKTRQRFGTTKAAQYGDCPFAEKFVAEKRNCLVRQSSDHGIRWCTNEMNRFLRTPWLFTVAKHYISEQEGRAWASRGTAIGQHTRKMAV